MGLKLVTAPTAEPISLTQAKAHLRMDGTDEDSTVEIYRKSAIAMVDGPKGLVGRALCDQTWDYYLDEFPNQWCPRPRHGPFEVGSIDLPLPPLIQVQGIFYLDSSGAEQQVAASNYVVDTSGERGRILLASGGAWPSIKSVANSVRVRFRAGYISADSPDVEAVPFNIKAAILLLIGSLYENREQVMTSGSVTSIQLPWGVEQLLASYRIDFGIA